MRGYSAFVSDITTGHWAVHSARMHLKSTQVMAMSKVAVGHSRILFDNMMPLGAMSVFSF